MGSKSTPFHNLAMSTDSEAKILHYWIMEHPATRHIRIGPIWSELYQKFRDDGADFRTARIRTTLRVFIMLDEIAKLTDTEIPPRQLPSEDSPQ